jgi:hypothetical protein
MGMGSSADKAVDSVKYVKGINMWVPRKNLVGTKINRISVLSVADKKNFYLCRCDCGKEWLMERCNLTRATSCGCANADILYARNIKHGLSHTREYRAWQEIKTRCYNPNYKDWHTYGGRGIRVSAAWLESFEQFFSDMGECPSKHQIDRIDTNGDYEAGNCRWVTNRFNSLNRRNTRTATLFGTTAAIGHLADIHGIPYKRLYIWIAKDKLSQQVVEARVDLFKKQGGHLDSRGRRIAKGVWA